MRLVLLYFWLKLVLLTLGHALWGRFTSRWSDCMERVTVLLTVCVGLPVQKCREPRSQVWNRMGTCELEWNIVLNCRLWLYCATPILYSVLHLEIFIFKFLRKNIFVVLDTHEKLLMVLNGFSFPGLVTWNETVHAKKMCSMHSLHAAFVPIMQPLANC